MLFLVYQIDPKSVADGDTINVYVDTADPRESGSVPREVQKAAAERAKARAVKNYQKADALQKVIVDAGYRFLSIILQLASFSSLSPHLENTSSHG